MALPVLPIFFIIDINECTEMYNDNGVMKKLHNCDTIDESSCEDTVGSFICACGEGFTEQTGSNGEDICAGTNTCILKSGVLLRLENLRKWDSIFQ